MGDEPEAAPEAPPAAAGETDPQAALEASRKEVDGLLTRLKYLQADFENYRKRAARDAETLVRFAHEALLVRLLPVLDEFDAALAHVEGKAGEGLRMVHGNLVQALQDAGLQEIPAAGATFDPYVHEAVEQVPDSGLADGSVKAVVRKGYRLHEHVLRPAQVIVVKNGGETSG